MTKKQKTGKKIGIGIVIIGIFAIFVFIGWWNSTREDNNGEYPKNAVPVQVDAVKQDKIISKVKAKGVVEVKKRKLYMSILLLRLIIYW